MSRSSRNGQVESVRRLMRDQGLSQRRACAQVGLPESTFRDLRDREPAAGGPIERGLIVPDVHAPYHDERAWSTMYAAAEGFKPDTIVCIGDLGDFYAVSSHVKDPARRRTFGEELHETKAKRQELDDLGAARKVFCEGNHEDRLPRYIADKAPELADLPNLTPDALLELSANGWEVIPYKSHTQIGHLYLSHDAGSGGTGKYTTARALETFQHSVVIGHHHALGYLVQGDATGNHMVGAQFGWLGDFEQVDYLHRIKAKRNWAHGFGVFYHDTASGVVFLTPCPIVDYTACLEGVLYRG